MATIYKFVPFILKWEGGYVNDPDDPGGPTNKGVTLKTWQNVGYDKNNDGIIDEEDLKLIFIQDVVECVLKPYYWDRWKADHIRNQSIANMLVDWLWASGTTAITTVQRILNLRQDGIVGEKTLAAINNYPDPQELFAHIKAARIAYIEKVCQLRPASKRFKKGWLNRINDIPFAFAFLFCILSIGWTGCKSITSEGTARLKAETVLNTEKESNRQMEIRQDAVFSGQSGLTEDTGTVMETITVRFDTAISDSITGKHPVKEVSRTRLVRGKMLRSSILEEYKTSRTDSGFSHDRHNAVLKNTENSQMQKIEVSNTYRWLLASIALILLLSGIVWIIRKKIFHFF